MTLLWFYLALFLSIAAIKRFRRINVALNCIWFSHGGSISQDAIENLCHLSKSIQHSAYKKNYRLILWTDTKTLCPKTDAVLKRHRVEVKDYRLAFTEGHSSQTTRHWLQQLFKLSDTNNRLFFVMASDLFRLYLLLHYYPTEQRRYHYACYFDCNDINFNAIPNPGSFTSLQAIAFHFVPFSYSNHTIFQQIIGDAQDPVHPLLTNDVIITRNDARNPLLQVLLKQYHDNLNLICHPMLDFMDTLAWTKDTMKIMDDDMVKVIVFTTTHMTNILHTSEDQRKRVDLLAFNQSSMVRTPDLKIQDASQFISFDRDYDKGLTWCHRDQIPPQHTATTMHDQCRRFWHELFLHRYRLITAPSSND